MIEYNNQMNEQQLDIDENSYINTEPEMTEPVVGIVIGCSRLNVRMKPGADAKVVCTIECDSKVMIDEENSTKNFYKICTEVGIEGYCMKQFINISK